MHTNTYSACTVYQQETQCWDSMTFEDKITKRDHEKTTLKEMKGDKNHTYCSFDHYYRWKQ